MAIDAKWVPWIYCSFLLEIIIWVVSTMIEKIAGIKELKGISWKLWSLPLLSMDRPEFFNMRGVDIGNENSLF